MKFLTRSLMLLFLLSALAACGDDTTTDASPPDTGGDTDESDAAADAELDSGQDAEDDADERDADSDAGTDADAEPMACVPPTHFIIKADGTRAFQRLGSSGVSHAPPQLAQGAEATVEVTECDELCESCNFVGPVAPVIETSDRRRCMNDLRQTCTADADCEALPGVEGAQVCRYLYGMISANPMACGGIAFNPRPGEEHALVGEINLRTGRTVMSRFEIQVFATGGGRCPVCVGDTSLGDGEADGTCQTLEWDGPTGGSNPYEGQSCDGHFIFSTLGGGVTSLDCPTAMPGPSARATFAGSTDGSRVQLTDASVDCGDEKCFCGVCEDMPAIPCMNAAGCPTGECSGTAAASPSRANYCAEDSPCVVDPETSRGQCMDAMGTTLGCFSGEVGAEINASGFTRMAGDDYLVGLGSVSCIPSVPVPGSDAFLGLPGPLANETSLELRPIYVEE